jgi:hypothetical protein
LRLAGAGALHLGLAADLGIHGLLGGVRVATGGTDQPGRGPLLVIEQRLQQVFRRDTLVELADRYGLRGLEEAPRTFGEFLDVHPTCPSLERTGIPRPRSGSEGRCLLP